MSREDIITQLQSNDIRSIFEELGIEHVYLVGSYARNEQTDVSDIDLLYTRKAWKRIGWLYFMRKKLELEQKLWKKIDLVNERYIYQDIKPYLESDKLLVY